MFASAWPPCSGNMASAVTSCVQALLTFRHLPQGPAETYGGRWAHTIHRTSTSNNGVIEPNLGLSPRIWCDFKVAALLCCKVQPCARLLDMPTRSPTMRDR